MLKCNLKDLYVVSDEAARYAGFFSQFDLFLLGKNTPSKSNDLGGDELPF